MDIMDHRYTLHDQLGKGGMGVVYRAFDNLEGKYVALKCIEADPAGQDDNPLAASPRFQHMLLAHEFRTVASLRHPNIISVLDYGFTGRQLPFFVMELLAGAGTILEAARVRDSRGKVDLLIQMLQAIIYLHHHGILHRDLKPTNVLVTQSGQVKVLDFGLAVKAGEYQEQAGTVHYMAPEVVSGTGAVEASDLYAVGVIAYEMFTGSCPFDAANLRALAEKIMSAEPDMAWFANHLDDLVLGELTTVVARLLEKQPEDRYPDALSAVRALCHTLGEPLPPDEGPLRESFLQAGTFVGRERETEELQWALRQAKAGCGSAWLVGGESGIGKSRLLDELRIHALTEDVMVLRGQSAEGNDSPAQCWADVLRPLLLSVPASTQEASVFQAIMPDSVSNAELPSPDHPLSAVIAKIFSRIKRPTLLLLEDLQWASLEPLKALIPMLHDLPLLIVGSYRSEEAPHLPDQLTGTNVIKLDKLSYQDMAALSSSMLGSAGRNPHLLDLVYKETEGNAFFMVEVIRAWAEEAGHLGEVAQYELPDSVLTGGMQHFVQRRLKRVPDWAYGGLQVAAVLGRKLDLEILDKILSPILSFMTGADISVTVSTIWREKRSLTLNDWLLVCADAAILEVQNGDWRFTHDKLREQVLTDLDADQMRLLRRQIEKAAGTR
jgi:eukaryotic-like serine/threonine-protein kinase